MRTRTTKATTKTKAKTRATRRRLGNGILRSRNWVAEWGADLLFTLGLRRPMDAPIVEEKGDSQPVNQLINRPIPTLHRPLRRLGTGGSSTIVRSEVSQRLYERTSSVLGRGGERDVYEDFSLQMTAPIATGRMISEEEAAEDFSPCDVHCDVALLSPEPIAVLGEKRRVVVTVESLASMPACHPHQSVGLKREFSLLRVRRGANRVYRLLLPTGRAIMPHIIKTELTDGALQFFTPEEMIDISDNRALRLRKLSDYRKEHGDGNGNGETRA